MQSINKQIFDSSKGRTFRYEELVSLFHDAGVHDGVEEGVVFPSLLVGDHFVDRNISHVVVVESHQRLDGRTRKRITWNVAEQSVISRVCN